MNELLKIIEKRISEYKSDIRKTVEELEEMKKKADKDTMAENLRDLTAYKDRILSCQTAVFVLEGVKSEAVNIKIRKGIR